MVAMGITAAIRAEEDTPDTVAIPAGEAWAMPQFPTVEAAVASTAVLAAASTAAGEAVSMAVEEEHLPTPVVTAKPSLIH